MANPTEQAMKAARRKRYKMRSLREALKFVRKCEYTGGGLCDGCRNLIDAALGKEKA